jgi:beta-lactamase regulating signal transducer with metallopeptidase domain
MSAWFAGLAVAVSNSAPLAIVVKATLLFAGGWLAFHLLGRARAAVRHLTLAAVFAMAGALPVLVLAVPAVTVRVDGPADATTPAPAATEATATPLSADRPIVSTPASAPLTTAFAMREIVFLLWGIGAIVSAVPLLRAAWWVRGVRRTALPWPDGANRARRLAGDRGSIAALDIVQHEATATPLTFGSRRPTIVFPPDAADWDGAEVDRALLHELEHVRRRDWLVHGVVRAVCAIYWFQPLAWWAWRRLALDAERACDDAVLAAAEAPSYARQLVDLAGRVAAAEAPAALGMARRSDLSRRVTALLDAGQARGRAGAAIAAATLVGAIAVLGLVSPLRAAYDRDGLSPDAQDVASALVNQVGRSRSQLALDAALYEAVGAGDVPGSRELLDAGADANARVLGDGSPLIAAARRGDLTLAQLLVEHGADANMGVPGDGNPLIAAAADGRAEMVAFLLDRGAEIDRVVEGDENPLITASGEGHLDVVRLLIARGADVNARVLADTYPSGQEWRTPLSMARRGRHDAVVAALVAAGAR